MVLGSSQQHLRKPTDHEERGPGHLQFQTGSRGWLRRPFELQMSLLLNGEHVDRPPKVSWHARPDQREGRVVQVQFDIETLDSREGA